MRSSSAGSGARGAVNTMRRISALAFVTLLPFAGLDAEASAQGMDGMHAEGPVVVRAARLLDVASGEMLTDAVVVVENGLIAAVNPTELPEGAHEMDLGDVTLLPGFMDAHTHIAGEIGANSFTSAVTDTVPVISRGGA